VSPVDVSGTVALVAIGLLTANLLLGLLLSVGYNPVRRWPRRRLKLFKFHNWTGYVALGSVALHVFALLLSKSPRFTLLDVLVPLWSPEQPKTNTVGAIGFVLLAFAVLTSIHRVRTALGRHWWKPFHYSTYGAAAAFFLHGVLADPELQGRPPDFIDAEKVWVEVCAGLVIGGILWRIEHRRALRRRATSSRA
jgi:DMSO/TMAO reductase YedYZ heme-binding membrane subunit